MAVLSYNEERYGLDRCSMIAFYPRSRVVKEEGVRPKAKAIEQAHMADHVLASVSAVYTDFLPCSINSCTEATLVSCRIQGGGAGRIACKSRQGEACRHHWCRVHTWCHGHAHGHRRRFGELSLSQHQVDHVHRCFREQRPERPEGVIDCLAGGQECRGQ